MIRLLKSTQTTMKLLSYRLTTISCDLVTSFEFHLHFSTVGWSATKVNEEKNSLLLLLLLPARKYRDDALRN